MNRIVPWELETNKKTIFAVVYSPANMTEQEPKTNGELRKIKNVSAEEKWYALYTRPRAEKLVFQRLVEAGIETFLPLQKTYRIWSDRKKLVEKPLLSSYIFVKTIPKNFPIVFRTNGVVKFISFEGQPVAIPPNQINNLRLLIDSDADIEVTSEKFAPGDNVEVVSGSLVGLTGELIKIGSHNRVIIRIDRLDKNLILKIPRSFLRKM
jgi:transcription antitermination factor NusG